MSNLKPMNNILQLIALIFLSQTFHISLADVGTASHYSAPYTPNACYGNDFSRIPKNDMFGAAGEGIWEGGSACGRKYLVRCLSSSTRVSKACNFGKVIEIVIIDRAETAPSKPSKSGTTFILSDAAYSAIANPSVPDINLEYRQVL